MRLAWTDGEDDRSSLVNAPNSIPPWLARALPPELGERVVSVSPRAPRDGFVLCWIRMAVRGHENPAIDTALRIGKALNRPVFVYHAVSERYPYASDRHHAFILEGARDVSRELRARGIGYAFHLERAAHEGRDPKSRFHLTTLAERAACIVTDHVPVAPLRGWASSLASRVAAPVVEVDAACVVPIPLVARPFDRAFAFRDATRALAEERIARGLEDAEVHGGVFVPDLPFEPVDLEEPRLLDLLSDCDIDHTVAPVPDGRGGSVAGYARLDSFLRRDLSAYASGRNDPLEDCTSRLSAYLHYGHVSPLRVARAFATAQHTEARVSAEKVLDELLVWRELPWHFCHHHPDHASTSVLPAWARDTLHERERDPRIALPSWEQLARGETGDRLWDACQRSLRVHGELHNNLRMTWGKAMIGWTRDAGTALRLLEDLNHRYALDGRDPASYGGLLWTLGLFDRPFPEETKVLGKVRSRPLAFHARRLDVARYDAFVRRPAFARSPKIAVIGAGIAGLSAARALIDQGLEVIVVDKGRRPGGRTSARPKEGAGFDHGAQFFTAHGERFRGRVASWEQEGVIARWSPRVVVRRDGELVPHEDGRPRYVGVPHMAALAAHLAKGLDVRCEFEVTRLGRAEGRWLLGAKNGAELDADLVLLTAPPIQSNALLHEDSPLREPLSRARLAPCWAVMVELEAPAIPSADVVVDRDPSAAIAWIASEASKPGRPAGHRLTIHASPAWTRANLEVSADEVATRIIDFAGKILGTSLAVRSATAHRWRYALVEEAVGAPALWDGARGLGVAGDALLGGRIEAAWESGAALAGHVLRSLAADPAPPRVVPGSTPGLFDPR